MARNITIRTPQLLPPMDELYIPPCCIDRKLPPIVRAGGPCSFFYSQGDWGVAKLWGALASLVSGTDGNTLCVLVIDDVDEFLLRIIANYMDRRWIRAMVLITSTDRTSMVKAGLSGCLDSICYCGNRDEAKHSNLWIRSNGKLSLAVVGPLDKGSGNKHFCSYTASLSQNFDRMVALFRPWRSIVRLHASIKGKDPLFDLLLK